MTVHEALDYISFFAFRCNGTSVLAEIHRVVMSKLEYYQKQVERYTSFYEFLFFTAKDIYPSTAVGSCVDCRCQYSAGSNETVWCDHQSDLLALCQRFYNDPKTIQSVKTLRSMTSEVLWELATGTVRRDKSEKRFKGVGPFGAMQFIHIASLLGLVPLYCITYAELMGEKLGPAILIRKGLQSDNERINTKKCNDFMIKMTEDLVKIWGVLITLALVENMLCELCRSYKQTVKKMNMKKGEALPEIDVIMDEEVMEEGRVNDLCFFDESRNTVQNFFAIRMTGSDASHLRPVLLMRIATKWEDQETSTMCLTNWCVNESDRKHLSWSNAPLNRDFGTSLNISKQLFEIYKV